MLRRISKPSSNRFGNGPSGRQDYMNGNDRDAHEEEHSMSDEASDGDSNESRACEGGNFGINDFLSHKENSHVLRKFFIFVLLIILSPVILIVLYKYLFMWCFGISKDTCLLISLFFVVVYIISLTLLYAYLAFNEEEVPTRGVPHRYDRKWR
ncbi:hypothetical protein AK88_04104 [Plasmodium fragile]|uniref:Uncharacterized protein n=1 Tax=Plasmodium fragile TaxID=5857 RepID=A0A0D9QGV4_PLAFR|nr:uncharacterized protein AK88_04104 [Plasmodium fragile]KJP86290.1 hypothetical protein AK88_04104 [Plasmodium fragile]